MQTLPSLSAPLPNPEADNFKSKGPVDHGYYLLRTNYQFIKPYSKYTEEGARPRSPNLQYSNLPDETIKKNTKNPSTLFLDTTRYPTEVEKKPRHYVERYVDSYNQHLIRGISASNPYCYLTKEAHDRHPPIEHSASQLGAQPSWGTPNTGFRTRSHFVGEPVERFSNIDLYRRPPTNQPGKIIFDHGRPNNGYYLQRNQYDNTWFGGNHKLNQTDILRDIDQKPLAAYEANRELNKEKLRARSAVWPFSSEYEDKFALHTTTKDFEMSFHK